MEISVEPGKTYAVTTSWSCTVTDADGLELCTASSGSQAFFVATTPTVTTSDDKAKVSRANFSCALARQSAGGGADQLPLGYTRAEFLESTGTQYIELPFSPLSEANKVLDVGLRCETQVVETTDWKMPLGCSKPDGKLGLIPYSNSGANRIYFMHGEQRFDYTSASLRNLRAKTNINWLNSGTYHVETEQRTIEGELEKKDSTLTWGGKFRLFSVTTGTSAQYSASRIWSVAISHNEKALFYFIPALAPTGTPCMFDLVSKQPFGNAGSGHFIAGFTLPQARKLGTLPAGTALTVSLPVGWQEDDGVVIAIAQATAKGCVITHADDWSNGGSAASSSFALRRVWVRKTQDANGNYVDATNTRWLVEWCVDVIGADPESLGYERFRSVDAAVAYWELVPYVDPNAEPETEPETLT